MPARGPEQRVPLWQRLSLFDFLLSQLGFASFDDIAKYLRELPPDDSVGEGSRYYRVLSAVLPPAAKITPEELATFDANITRYVSHIGHRRGGLHLKYFQWLIALLAEIYLSRFFADKESLRRDVEQYRQEQSSGEKFYAADSYTAAEMTKIALWSATGSGKTLLMHINLLQYRHYLQEYGGKINRTILLVPNDSLARQHLAELRLSSIRAEIFSKDAPLYRGQTVDIVTVHMLREESGQKTVAVDYFENNNLVLVDEGHQGTSGDTWRRLRGRLTRNGFSLEYSATFGQLTDEKWLHAYGKNIWFDYSYRRFYDDGYGKGYFIYNLRSSSFDNKAQKRRYLTACLLTYYRQLRIYHQHPELARQFGVAKPLWVFVGARVNNRGDTTDEASSDILAALTFMSDFVRKKSQAVKDIDAVLHDDDALVDAHGNPLFASAFADWVGRSAEEIYREALRWIFNTEHSVALHLARLGRADGEIAVLAGQKIFGVINIGDRDKFIKDCKEKEPNLVADDEHFTESLFRTINDSSSPVNVLIGAKKFMEGWNSWRVSTMGLLHVGQNEGVQIIQLFGRGVRLRGFEGSLKRRDFALNAPNEPVVDGLEKLNIFGVKANFMEEFRNYLQREGVKREHEELITVTHCLDQVRLKMVRPSPKGDFKRDEIVRIKAPNQQTKMPRLFMDCRERVEVIAAHASTGAGRGRQYGGRILAQYKPFFNRTKMYEELQEYKADKGFYNMILPRRVVDELLDHDGWYRVVASRSDEIFDKFSQVHRWQQVAVALMKKYIHFCWTQAWNEWEAKNRKYHDLTDADSNMISEYRLLLNESQKELCRNLGKISERILDGAIPQWGLGGLSLATHLYKPLLYVDGKLLIDIKPMDAVLNNNEKNFACNVQNYCMQESDFFAGKKLYLLRNRTRGRGVGFFEANGFYPDFIMWLLADGLQHIVFIDPKGLRQIAQDDPKINFYRTVQDEVEKPMAHTAPEVRLHSFIVSATPREEMLWGKRQSHGEHATRNLLFADDDLYIKRMFDNIMARG